MSRSRDWLMTLSAVDLSFICEAVSSSLCSRQRVPNAKKEDLEALFHLPLAEAAKVMGKGLTCFKKLCRSVGIARWPFRQVKSLDILMKQTSDRFASAHTTGQEVQVKASTTSVTARR